MLPDLYTFIAINVAVGSGAFLRDPHFNRYIPFHDRWAQMWKALVVLQCFFTASVWCVKASLLTLFYRLLGPGRSIKRTLWWGTVVAVLSSFIADVTIYSSACPTPSVEKCLDIKVSTRILAALWTTTATDVLSDLILLGFAVSLLWHVPVNLRQKLGLVGLFLLSAMTVVFAVIRVSVSFTVAGVGQTAYISFWSACENCVAIVVASLMSARLAAGSRGRGLDGAGKGGEGGVGMERGDSAATSDLKVDRAGSVGSREPLTESFGSTGTEGGRGMVGGRRSMEEGVWPLKDIDLARRNGASHV